MSSYADPNAGRGARGRGGGDFQRGGRGGGDFQRGGRGGTNPRTREQEAVKLQSAGFREPLQMTVNQVKLSMDSSKRLFLYTISYEFKENASDDRGGGWKEAAVARFLQKIEEGCPECKQAVQLAVHTGQQILTPLQLPDVAPWDFRLKEKIRGKEEITRVYGLQLRAEGEVVLSLPQQSLWVNLIIGKAVSNVFTEKIGDRFVDIHQRQPPRSGIITMNAITPKAMRIRADKGSLDVLQVDVAKTVMRDTTHTCEALVSSLRTRRPQDYRRVADETFKGRRVLAAYAGNVLKVKDILWDQTAGSAVGLKGNPTTTYQQYFKSKFNITLKTDGAIFLCKHTRGGGRPLPFPAEVLVPMFLDESQTRELPLLCSIYPKERFELVNSIISRLLGNADVMAVLNGYGLTVTPGLLKVRGSVVRAPTLYVPVGDGFQAVNASDAEFLGQGGFAKKLIRLQHPTPKSKSDKLFAEAFLVDAELLRRLGKDTLMRFHPPLPDPVAYRFDSPKAVKEDKSLNNRTVFAVVRLPEVAREPYEGFKKEFARRGFVSQMVARDPSATIPLAIAQQICAKTGLLNTVVDIAEVAPALSAKGTRDVLIIGVDVGSSMNIRDDRSQRVVREQNFTVSFVAFHVRGRKWKPYANHCQIKGGSIVVHTSGADEDGCSTAQSDAARRESPSEVLESRFNDFLKDALQVFNLGGPGSAKGTVLVYRGCPSEGEVTRSALLQLNVKEALPGWDYAVLVAQARSHTRFGWQPPSSASSDLCNAPRGFCTFEATDTFLTEGDRPSEARAFSLVGANCTLGHASNALYVITGKSNSGVSENDIVTLTYAMCYLYPNKADALPQPLPMKCAAEYARKFAPLSVVKELPKRMRQSMHYL